MGKHRNAIVHSVIVKKPIKQAFEGFVNDFSSWWPQIYTWSDEVLDVIKIEPFEGGKCFERGPNGFECDWGRVLRWEPPARLVFSWQISPARAPEPNPEKASEVDVQFTAEGDAETTVTLEHRKFSRHGEGHDEYKQAMESDMGWPYILSQYVKYIS